MTEHAVQVEAKHTTTPTRKSTRTRQKPLRFRDENFVNPMTTDIDTFETTFEENHLPKVKRFLAQRSVNGKTSYLTHIVGEPAQNAIWIEHSKLGPKALSRLQSRPPPLLQ